MTCSTASTTTPPTTPTWVRPTSPARRRPTSAPPEPADTAEIRRRIEAGEWVVDLRNRTAFSAGHVPGTYNLGIDGQFSTYVGWLMPWGADLTLLGDTPDQVAEARRELVRIGIDEVAGAASGSPLDWTDERLATLPRASFAELADVLHHRSVQILDVRRESEHAAGHIDGALNIPIHEVLRRLDEVPQGEVWVHCAGGYRASVVASILAAHGRRAVAVDDEFEKASGVGLT